MGFTDAKKQLKVIDDRLANNLDVRNLEEVVRSFMANHAGPEMTNLLQLIVKHRVSPSDVVLQMMLVCFSQENLLLEVQATMDYMQTCGCNPSIKVFNTVLAFYGDKMMFDMMLELYKSSKSFGNGPNIATYNIMIHALARSGQHNQVQQLLQIMKRNTYVAPDRTTYNNLLEMHSTDGNVDELHKVLADMREANIDPDFSSFRSLLKAYIDSSNFPKLLETMDKMMDQGYVLDLRTFNWAFTACHQINSVDVLLELVKRFEASNLLEPGNVALYALQTGLRHDCHPKFLIQALDGMLDHGCKPTLDLFNHVLKKLASSNTADYHRHVFRRIRESGMKVSSETCFLLLSGVPNSVPFSVSFRLLEEVEKIGAPITTQMFDLLTRRAEKLGAHDELLTLVARIMSSHDILPNAPILDRVFRTANRLRRDTEIFKMFDMVLKGAFNIEKPSQDIFRCVAAASLRTDSKALPAILDKAKQYPEAARSMSSFLVERFLQESGEQQETVSSALISLGSLTEKDATDIEKLLSAYRDRLASSLFTRTAVLEDTSELYNSTIRVLKLLDIMDADPETILRLQLLAVECLMSTVKCGFSSMDVIKELTSLTSNNPRLIKPLLMFKAAQGDSDAIICILEDQVETASPGKIKERIISSLDQLKHLNETRRMWEVFQLAVKANVAPSPAWCQPILEGLAIEVTRSIKLPPRLVIELQELLRSQSDKIHVATERIPLSAEFDDLTRTAVVRWLQYSPTFNHLHFSRHRGTKTTLDPSFGEHEVSCLQAALATFGLEVGTEGKLDEQTVKALHLYVRSSLPTQSSWIKSFPLPSTKKVDALWEYIEKSSGVADKIMYITSFTILEIDTSRGGEQIFYRLFTEMEKHVGLNLAAYQIMISYLAKQRSEHRVVKLFRRMKKGKAQPKLELLTIILDCLSITGYHPEGFKEVLQMYVDITEDMKHLRAEDVPADILLRAFKLFKDHDGIRNLIQSFVTKLRSRSDENNPSVVIV